MPQRTAILARNILYRQILVGTTAPRSIIGSGLRPSDTALGASGNEGSGRQVQSGALPQNNATGSVALLERGVRHLVCDILFIRVFRGSESFGCTLQP